MMGRFFDWLFDSVLGFILFVATIFTVVVVSVATLALHADHSTCIGYGKSTGRPVKFVRYNYVSWDCLTPNPSQPGTWIPTDQLVGVR